MTSRCLLLVSVALWACRVDPVPGAPLAGSEQDDEPGSPPPSGETTGGRGGSSATAQGGRAPLPTSGAAGATDDPPGECDAQGVTLDEVRTGAVLGDSHVALVATATSQKFLVSQSEAGSCLWGAFVGEDGADGEPRGLLVVSYGPEAPGDARCEPGADAISDDLVPGDSVRVVGRASSFAPASCVATFPAPQFIADARCPFERVADVAPVDPVELPLDVADELARGTDADLVRRWTGGLVRLVGVSALPNDYGDGAVRPFGVVALAETELEVHADIEYGDLGAGGPRAPGKSLEFPYPISFRSITGLVYLDYCDYALAPRRRCLDFDPPSAGCP